MRLSTSLTVSVLTVACTRLFYVQGVLLTPAVIPVALTVMSKRQSKHAAFFGTLFGTTCGLIGWMLGCKKVYGEINITNLALPYAAISGAAPGLVMSGLASLVITAISPSSLIFCSNNR